MGGEGFDSYNTSNKMLFSDVRSRFRNQSDYAFRPGKSWLDVDGNPIRAHSGGFLRVKHGVGTICFWYGADSYAAGDGTNAIINVYTSRNLYSWKKSLTPAFNVSMWPGSVVPGERTFCDRPKVIYNPATGLYVLWMKSSPMVTVATSPDPLGALRHFFCTCARGTIVGFKQTKLLVRMFCTP